ncbi:MAG: hypothetical protein AAF666_09720 [Pseudomonadota bacterium]
MRALLILTLIALAAPALADSHKKDKREGYYYPPVSSEEIFAREIPGAPPADRGVRTNFIVEMTRAMLEAPDTPPYVIFAKGGQAEHMVIIGLNDQMFKTLYRARAVLAQLTGNARGTEFFRKNNLQSVATWFDLAKMMDFEDIVISDGETWSHRVRLE